MSPVAPDCNDVTIENIEFNGEIGVNTDDLEACCAAGNALLQQIEDNTDGIEGTLTQIRMAVTDLDANTDDIEALLASILTAVADLDANTDGLEACCAAGNVTLASILTAVDGLEGFTDGVEALLSSISSAVADLDANTDGIEALLATIITHVDGLEACCTASNVLLTTIDGTLTGIEANTNGIEGLLTTANSSAHIEDTPAGSGFQGVAVLGVRNDADAVVTSTDGDYSGIAVDSAGRVKTVANVPAAIERKLDGDDILGAGSIVIPDGVFSFGVTVQTLGGGVTISGPDFTSGAVNLYAGQSINVSADGSNTLNGPITITTTALSVVNATWVKA